MAIQLRRGNEADLVAANLLPGEPAYTLDTGKLLIGDGDGGTDMIPTIAQMAAAIDDAVDAALASGVAAAISAALADFTTKVTLFSGGSSATSGTKNTDLALSQPISSFRYLEIVVVADGNRLYVVPVPDFTTRGVWGITVPSIPDDEALKGMGLMEINIYYKNPTTITVGNAGGAVGRVTWNGLSGSDSARVNTYAAMYIDTIYGIK